LPTEWEPAKEDREDSYDCEKDYCVVVSQFVGYEAGDGAAKGRTYVDNRQDRVGEVVAIIFVTSVGCYICKRDEDPKFQKKNACDRHAECWCGQDAEIGVRCLKLG